jgi:ATP-binding cassette subfamily F protein 3
VAVIGPNGAGKTTLLRLVAGELAPDAGEIALGHGVVAGYYAQHHFDKASREGRPTGGAETPAPPLARDHDPGRSPAPHRGPAGGPGQPPPAAPALAREPRLRTSGTGTLDPDRTILDTLWDLVPDRGEAYVRSVAGSFLFSGDDVEKKVGVLSGGERARVALAKLLLVPANLLVMDEPTNHLDLDSSEALIEALQAYQGTLLFVSHNRSFLNGLATVIWEVKDGGVLAFPGNLDDWLYHERQAADATGTAPLANGRAGAPAAARSGEKDRRRAEAEARNARYAREKPVRDEIARLEERIARLEEEEKAASRALADPALYQDFARAKPFLDAHRQAKARLEELYARWEHQQELLAALSDP